MKEKAAYSQKQHCLFHLAEGHCYAHFVLPVTAVMAVAGVECPGPNQKLLQKPWQRSTCQLQQGWLTVRLCGELSPSDESF